MSITLRFEIIQEGEVVRTEELDQDVIKVGKLSSSHLRLEDPNVSRIHAVIEKGADGTLDVIDLGSATGTYVNGAKVTKSSINDGDELTFGDTTIRVHVVEAAVQAEAPVEPSVVVAPDVAAPAAESASGAAQITTPDGTVVEPYTLQGYYDDAGNYIPGYYDNTGEFHLGYGYYDEAGNWTVSHGYYDPAGEWVDSDNPVAAVGSTLDAPHLVGSAGVTALGEETSWLLYNVRDKDEYQESFFNDRGGDTLEVAMIWGDHVLAVNNYERKGVTIGPNEKNDFVMEHSSFNGDQFPLVVFDGGYSVVFTDQMTGLIQQNDETMTLEEAVSRGIAKGGGGRHTLQLKAGTSARIDIADTTFLIHFTDLPVVVGGGLPIDTTPLPYIVVSGVAHFLFLLLTMMMPDAARSLDLDGFDADDRFVQLMITPEQEEEEEPDHLDGDGEEAAAKHKGEEGKAGKEDAPDDNKKLAIKGETEDLELKRAQDTEIAMNAGIASELMASSLFGTSDTSIGSDAVHALGNLTGEGFGESKGFGGLGMHGAGRGGGGISERGIGLASVGTAGRGGKGRGGGGYGKGAGDLGERSARVPKIVPGRPVVQGSLDKEIIRRVVRQHRREIKFCYEKELQKNKNLAGTVKVRFTISQTGSVVSATVASSSLNNKKVERCMTGKIRRWVFPEPKGGGIVIVNYPFNLSS